MIVEPSEFMRKLLFSLLAALTFVGCTQTKEQ